MESIEEIHVWATQLALDWSKAEIHVQGPALEEQIAKLETELGFTFPADAKEFYKVLNGFREFDWDSHMISIWSLERILDEYDGNGFIGFADFLISSLHFGFVKGQHGIYKNYYLNPLMLVLFASSFKEAIDRINAGDDSIY
jgi:hypothetical protein